MGTFFFVFSCVGHVSFVENGGGKVFKSNIIENNP